MKNKILLVTLKDCKICKNTKKILGENGVNFIEISCDDDPSVCDQIEDLTKSSRYPMAIIKNTTENKDTIYFLTNDYIQLGKENKIDNKVSTVGLFSSDEIINNILKSSK